MKKFIYVLLSVFIVSTMLIMPISAATVDMPAGSYVGNDVIDFSSVPTEQIYYYDFTIDFDGVLYNCEYIAITYNNLDSILAIGVIDPSNPTEAVAIDVYQENIGWLSGEPIILQFSESFEITDEFEVFFNQNFNLINAKFNLFTTCYNLIVEYVFGGEGVVDGVLIDPAQHLTVTILSTIAWIFVLVIPFIVVWWFIKVVSTAFGRF